MARLLTLVVLASALLSTLAEAKSQRIQVTAAVVETTFIGGPRLRPAPSRGCDHTSPRSLPQRVRCATPAFQVPEADSA
jgi:hypothetical protein